MSSFFCSLSRDKRKSVRSFFANIIAHNLSLFLRISGNVDFMYLLTREFVSVFYIIVCLKREGILEWQIIFMCYFKIIWWNYSHEPMNYLLNQLTLPIRKISMPNDYPKIKRFRLDSSETLWVQLKH